MSDVALSILIVNWNTRAFLEQCLASLPYDEVTLEVIVVDNASTDGSADMLRTRFPRVTCVAGERNLGFAAGNNLAAASASGKYLLLLNPDTVVPPGALSTLIEFANAHPRGGAFGPLLRNADGSPQRSCWRGDPGLGMALADALYLWRVPWLAARVGSDYRDEELRTARTVDHLLGACLMVRRETWQQVGGLDEEYFLFLEETDWCARARRSGWDIFFVPAAQVTHFGQASMRLAPSRNLPQYYRSYARFYRARHHSLPGELVLKGIFVVGCLVRVGMWSWRQLRAQDDTARKLAVNMRSGYFRTLRELNSF
jgi:GT2 family glycosyltransferase